jgi:glycosyltransferase involved in cell wall biosynthesis
MNILITTGIYPPAIGGPSQYAKNIEETWRSQGHTVSVATFTTVEHSLPSGIRHLYFFLKILPKVVSAQAIIALDTFSVGWPTVMAAQLFGKKVVIRTGGDFLWEGYVERTGHLVLLKHFYTDPSVRLSAKERLIQKMTRWALQNAHRIAFSTQWQRQLFVPAYSLDIRNTLIVENFYDVPQKDRVVKTNEFAHPPRKKVFVGSTRKLKWKNIPRLEEAFAKARTVVNDIELVTAMKPYAEFLADIRAAHAVILVSLGDISPNLVLDAIREGVPCIFTQENGITDRVGQYVRLVNPEDVDAITATIVEMCDPAVHQSYTEKVREFSFQHSWTEISNELLAATH